MTTMSLKKKLCSVALSAVMAAGAICAVAPSAHADAVKPQYLASVDSPTISATNDQLNLPFDPNLYYAYSLLSEAGKKVWDLTLPQLLAFDPGKTPSDSAVTYSTEKNGDMRVTFDLVKKNIKAKPADVLELNNLFVYNEARLFILPVRKTPYTADDQGNVKTVYFVISKNWTAPGYYQKLLVQMESMVTDILVNVDPRQNDAQRLNAFYDAFQAKERYGSYRSAVTGGESRLTDAFINGKVVCSGYSKAFEYLAMRAGVASAYIMGWVSGGGYHAWNVVKLDDGNWYQVDSTWDDYYGAHGAGNRTWFLKGTKSINRSLQKHYSVMPAISATNYQFSSWLAPEDVAPRSKKAVDQIVAAVKATFAEQPSMISKVNKITVSLPSGKTSGSGLFDGIYQNNLQKALKKLNLAGTATITISRNGGLGSVDDVVKKGLSVEYKLSGATESYGWANGQFVNKTTGTTISDAEAAKNVLDMGSKVATRVLEAHSAEVSDISGLMVNLPETVAYQGTTTAEKEAVAQIKANLQGKFDGELSVMVMGNYTSLDELLAKGLVVGYKAPSGKYYTLMGGKVIAS